MARPLRIEYPGALYHVTARGNGRAEIILDDGGRAGFLEILAAMVSRFGWLVHAYCLMDNHYHLLMETPEANLGHGMRQLNGIHTQRLNRAHGRTGHVFEGRYKSILVEKERHLLELSRYVVLNPVRAGMVGEAGDWRWSSFLATAGEVETPDWLHTGALLALFSGGGIEARRAYARFTAEGVGAASPWESLRHQMLLGGEYFIGRMADRLAGGKVSGEVPRAQRRAGAQTLEQYEAAMPSRDQAIREAWASGAYSLAEIGRHFGIHYSRVSHIASAKRKT
jgi:REP element-mobilizing transposase RayT